LYVSYLQQPDTYPGGYVATHLRQDLVIRTITSAQGVSESLTAAIRRIAADVDKDQPIYDVMTMEQVLSKFVSPWRFYMQLMGLFAGVALILAAVGITESSHILSANGPTKSVSVLLLGHRRAMFSDWL
jgi:hypothetical protein